MEKSSAKAISFYSLIWIRVRNEEKVLPMMSFRCIRVFLSRSFFGFISLFPAIRKTVAGTKWQFKIEMMGHMMKMLRNITFLLERFLHRPRAKLQLNPVDNTSYSAWIAASARASCPAQTWSTPTACWTSFLATCITTFTAIWCNTPLTPIGQSSQF